MTKEKTTIMRPQSRGDSRFVRVLTMLVLLLMTVTGARAEATIVNGQTETSYTSLKEALEVVKDGDVIKLDWNATMTEGVETATEGEFEAALAAPGIYRFTSAAPAAENVTNIIFNNLGLENAYDLTSTTLTVGNINLDFAKGTGTTTPAFYTSGGGTVRLNKGNTMSIDASGATITKIVFTYASEVTPEFSTGSYTSSSKTWEGEATTLTVTNAYTTNTQIRIKSMDVYYSVASAAGEATYKVTVNDGGKDADKWTITPAEATTTGVNAGTEIKATYSGTKRVKSVKAEKKSTDKGKSLAEATVGMIIGSNGKAYEADDKDNLPSGVTTVAKVCYVDGNGHGLAMALADEGEMDWTTAQSACAAHTPAVTGCTWKLATKDEWQQMINAVGGYDNLKNGFSSVGGTNLESDGYWTNTEYESDDQKAYIYYFFSSNMLNTGWKSSSCIARACFAF